MRLCDRDISVLSDALSLKGIWSILTGTKAAHDLEKLIQGRKGGLSSEISNSAFLSCLLAIR